MGRTGENERAVRELLDSRAVLQYVNDERHRQSAELAAIRRLLLVSKDTFSLSVAICNSPALRDHLIAMLRADVPSIRVIFVPSGAADPFDSANKQTRNAAVSAVFLINLEASIPSTAEQQPVLRTVNAARESWKGRLSCPIVFWLPEYAATLMSIHARDLWSWCSHRFEFVSEAVELLVGIRDRMSGNLSLAANVDADEKQSRIAELEQRIAEAGDPPSENLAPHVAVWLSEVGFLHYRLGDLNMAERMFLKS